nr:phosphotransferase [Actinopolymorpha pittospori]
MLERAKEWASGDDRISAALVYGSVATGRADEWSDLDLLVVTAGDREEVWAERQQIADRVLGGEGCVWAGEVSHQRPYRYAAYRADAAQLDLTMDDGRAKPWRGLADGFVAILDRDDIVAKLRADFEGWKPLEPDVEVSDGATWVWLKYLAGRLRRGQHWMVRCGLVSLAYERIVPLLGVSPNAVETALPAELRTRLHGAIAVRRGGRRTDPSAPSDGRTVRRRARPLVPANRAGPTGPSAGARDPGPHRQAVIGATGAIGCDRARQPISGGPSTRSPASLRTMPWDRDSLIAAVAAEGRDVDLSDAVRRSGWESVVLETRDGWILRFPRPHVAFEREVALLRRIAGRLPARTPVIVWTGERTKFAAYRKLNGCVFDVEAYRRAPSHQRDRLARSLAGFLVAMHAVLTPGEIAELGIPGGGDSDDAQILDRLDRVPRVVRHDVETLLAEIAALRRERAELGRPVVLHDDFHFGNVVLDGPVGYLVGVWDFSCVRMGDPSEDLRYLAGGPVDLLDRVAHAYEQLSGRHVDTRVATMAHRHEVVSDALDLDEPETLVDVVTRWRVADACAS